MHRGDPGVAPGGGVSPLPDTEPVFFASAAEFRAWLEAHHATSSGLWLGFLRAAAAREAGAKAGLRTSEAVEQALCFGWIDGRLRPLDERTLAVWYTRRRRGSRWSAINVRRVRDLDAAGLMRPEGLAAFHARSAEDHVGYTSVGRPDQLPEPWASRMRADAEASHWWDAQPASYRRGVLAWIMWPKTDATRERHFDVVLESCRRGEVIPPLRFATATRVKAPKDGGR